MGILGVIVSLSLRFCFFVIDDRMWVIFLIVFEIENGILFILSLFVLIFEKLRILFKIFNKENVELWIIVFSLCWVLLSLVWWSKLMVLIILFIGVWILWFMVVKKVVLVLFVCFVFKVVCLSVRVLLCIFVFRLFCSFCRLVCVVLFFLIVDWIFFSNWLIFLVIIFNLNLRFFVICVL